MAQWVKLPDNSYVNISQIEQASLSFDGINWWIAVSVGAGPLLAKGPFATQVAAQTALDNAIVNLGGSV